MPATKIDAHFLWPEGLWLLASLPLLVALYLWLIARRRPRALPYSNLGLVRVALAGASWRRHVPPALLLAAFACVAIAAARPTWDLFVPTQEQTIILAMDVSLSMRAKDVAPDRIGAFQGAARAFVRGLPAAFSSRDARRSATTSRCPLRRCFRRMASTCRNSTHRATHVMGCPRRTIG